MVNGLSISVWNATWLSSTQPKYIMSHRVDGINLVADLINNESRKWKEEVINNTLSVEEASQILSIGLVANGPEDRLHWCLETSREYAVHNCYRLLLCSVPNPSTDLYKNITDETKQLYKQLWAIKVPEKMKITVWQLLNNYVPTRVNLRQRRLVTDVACLRCGLGVESVLHVCSQCPFATLV